MDRRSWPWKKKSSEKTITATDTHNAPLASSVDTIADQDDTKSIRYVHVSEESYAHLTGLEDKVKILNENLSSLNEKLSSAQSDMVTKDNLVKQHAKVAEEAVSGWEKAEAEALALKQQLESVTLLKLTAEDRASHLDGALKECMKQVRNVKEESEQNLHDVVFAKTKQWEKAKAELEAKIDDLEEELLRSFAENAALSRTLQERSNLLMKINDEKIQADADIEAMKNDIQSCEREISSLKYELHVVSKELEIRNEENNMSVRSADVANKQHLEDIKKISKLEAECQRLRGLVRKKLPGPAALAQMKVEVESLGRDYGNTRFRRSPAKISNPLHVSPSGFALENMQQCCKENEFLTARMITMEEEMKILKEALSKRYSELQTSQNMRAKTTNKLRSLEAHFLLMNRQKSPEKSMTEIPFEIESNLPSLTSMSEDGIDEEGSCSESWATALISELSRFKKEKNVDKSNKANNSNQLELMDDFLEMERLACESTDTDGSITISNVHTQKDGSGSEQLTVEVPKTLITSNVNQPTDNLESTKNDLPLSKFRSRIVCLFESQSHDADMGKLLKDIKRIAHDADEESPQNSVGAVASETHSVTYSCMQKENTECREEVIENGMILKQDANQVMVQDLKDAISDIHNFVISIGKEVIKIQGRSSDDSGLTQRIDEFATSTHKVLCNEVSVHDFLLALSHILSETSFLSYIMPNSNNDGGSCSPDCIDKVTLMENKVAPYEHVKENFSRTRVHSHSSSDPEIDAITSLNLVLKTTLQKYSLEEFEQLKLQKENMETDLTRCKETLELTSHQLAEMEKHLADLKSQLNASEKSNCLAETQLKCMAESYKSLESQKQELETELNLLHTKVKMLENELQEEKDSHQEDLAKYKVLQDNMERNSKCSGCSIPSNADVDSKEREIAAAAEKLAECQETIFLLGKQLKSLRPSSESLVSSPNITLEDESSESASSFTNGEDQSEMENVSTITQRTGSESSLNGSHYSEMNPSDHTEPTPFPTSPLNTEPPKHNSSRSSSYSSSSTSLSKKHGRGFSQFFSRGRSEH